jgi:pimeloyl-ACP methyl ester carboxylesterase
MTDTTASARAPLKRIPIIVLPGIAGTRLTNPSTDSLVWNPMGLLPSEPGTFAADADALGNIGLTLVPDTTHRFAQVADRARVEPIRNYYNLIRSFYGALSEALHFDLRRLLAPRGVTPVVYCCGYDWRRSAALSAARLNKIADEAQEECNGEKLIIVAHSMGGIVAREFCKNLGGESRVRALILLGSPTMGAIKAYHQLKDGLAFIDEVRRVLNLGAQESRDFLRRLPAVYQLLPTQAYCSRVRRDFATFDRTRTGFVSSAVTPVPAMQFSDNSNSAPFYLDLYAGLRGDPATRAIVEQNLNAAIGFDTALTVVNTAYMHPQTICYLCEDLDTPGLLNVTFDGITDAAGVIEVRSRVAQSAVIKGDETVPADSANPQFLSNAFRLVRRFSGVDHVKLSANPGVINSVLQDVVALF